ncbi:hypothetical protein [Serinibacter salmoneus]|uniref:DUF8094 domain-containing protein n=1 Tax=Serinibacter salmoneus TaxID=556530 RepID=A0A2A9D0T6_9MICO|nr:hypothetical protein [Serinibacter salmoneus]PFG20274.1 hypothetical protein ATL40_1871 [Serinibacter salmoneus]
MRARMFSLTLAASLGLTLAACSEDVVPELQAPTVPEYAPPALSEIQIQDILADIAASIEAADEADDAAELGDRVTAPATDIREAQYALEVATGGETTPQELWTETDLDVITASDSWPRSLLAVTEPDADSALRLYLGIVQEGPRDPYRLVAWSLLLPGVETPTFADISVGSAPVTADQEGLVMTPTQALTRLADVLDLRTSEYADQFADDDYRTFLREELDGIVEGIEVAGDVDQAVEPGEIVFAIGTAEGGALVMGDLTTTVTLRRTVEDSELNLAGEMAELGGEEAVENAAEATYRSMVTLYIPPADAEDQSVRLLGAERVLASVERIE